MEFDETGDYIATGDKGGRVVLFQRVPVERPLRSSPSSSHKGKGTVDSTKQRYEYKFYCEFQSHEPEFDYLKSLEIEEKINKVKFCKRQNNAHFLLSTNDKTIKLWKVAERRVQNIADFNIDRSRAPPRPVAMNRLVLPKIRHGETVITATQRKVFAHAHAYHINSISLCSDGETYLSADDLRVNLWNLNISNQSFNIVDIKPTNMEELTEVITSAEFHPTHCNVFMYSSSKGTIKLADMRDSALCDKYTKVYEEAEDPGSRSFFSEIISSMSDCKFSKDGRYILSRDYLTLKLWDMKMENRPVKTIQIHEYLRSKLCDLYENDFIFDKFETAFSGDGNHMITGSYGGIIHILDRYGKHDTWIEASKPLPRNGTSSRPRGGSTSTPGGKTKLRLRNKTERRPSEDINPDTIDYSKKVLHTAWHPKEALVAVAQNQNLFLYAADERK